MAYFVVNKENNVNYIIIDNTTLAGLIGVHRHTIRNWFSKSGAKQKETEKYIITKTDNYYPPNTSKGNRLSMSERRVNKGDY